MRQTLLLLLCMAGCHPAVAQTDSEPPRVRNSTSDRFEGRKSTAPDVVRSIESGSELGELILGVRPDPNPYNRDFRWVLGVIEEASPTGVRITEVARNSAADNAGLEPGDYILDAGGYACGSYSGKFYKLSSTLQRAADREGWVELRVWNKRTQDEQLMWIQLKRTAR